VRDRDAMPSDRLPGPYPDTTLLHYPWVVIRFRCHYCERGGDSRLAACVVQYGARITLQALLTKFTAGCPWDPAHPLWKPRKYGHQCGAYLPDLHRGGPPDLPPSMAGLSLIEGGKGDMLPAEPGPVERRRRVGSDDV
jgi:hypothetical protein